MVMRGKDRKSWKQQNDPQFSSLSCLRMRLLFSFSIVFLLSCCDLHAQTAVADSIAADTTVYSSVDEEPEFPGGETALMAYLSKNIRYPVLDSGGCMCTSYYATFIVEKDGSITHVERWRPLPHGCCLQQYEQFLDIVRAMPRWKPGKKNGKIVRCGFMIPIKCLYPR
jgi:hypothetical protein